MGVLTETVLMDFEKTIMRVDIGQRQLNLKLFKLKANDCG